MAQNFHYQKALNLIKKNNVSEAISELKLCLKFSPRDISALNLLGLGYYLKCRFDKAENYWRQSLALKRKDNQAADYLELINKKDFLKLRQQYQKILFDDSAAKEKKINFLKELIKDHDELIEPYLVLGLLYKEKADYQKALEYLYQAYDLDSGNQNIKDYILECEEQENSIKLFDFNKYKKGTIALLTVFLAVFLIFSLSTGEPLEAVIKELGLSQNTAQSEIKEKNFEIESENKIAEKNQTENKNSAAERADKNIKEVESVEESLKKSDKSDLKLKIMEYQGFDNFISLELIQQIKKNEAQKNKKEIFNQYFKENREQELFNLGLEKFRRQNYQEAGIIFEQLYQFSQAEYLKRESLYLLARSSQLEEKYEAAEKFYRLYINNYPETNYYEEVLYTLGLLLNANDQEAEAEKVLQKLRNERPYSQYNNSRVYEILN